MKVTNGYMLFNNKRFEEDTSLSQKKRTKEAINLNYASDFPCDSTTNVDMNLVTRLDQANAGQPMQVKT